VGARTGSHQIDGNATAGVAELRRDGFASVVVDRPDPTAALAAGAVVVTKPLTFGAGLKVLFVNANGAKSLSFGMMDPATGTYFEGLAPADCLGVSGESTTRLEVNWKDSHALAMVAGKRFVLEVGLNGNDAELFSFWFAANSCGASNGWVAAGGKGFATNRDVEGSC
jgi:hypothetical protein